MWNKLFKSKSKSSKNLSNRSCSGTGLSVADPAAGGPSSSVAQFEQYGSSVGVAPEPVRMRSRSAVRDPDALDLATSHRDSIGVQMCGIPMRRSKLSSAFKSLSLKRSASKSRLKLAPQGSTAPDGSNPPAAPLLADEYDVLVAGKQASLRPCKSDNNLNEKQQYTEAEKEEPVYIEECKPYEPFEVSSEPPPNLELQPCPICSRKFAPASLTKHIGICERVQAKKRKPFDSSRQRREGTELASYLPKNFGLPQKTAIPVRKLSLSKTPTFERKEFSPTAAMSTSMPSAASTPKPALKRSMSQQNEPCPYCERCFGMKAYDRHVEWCREKALLSKNAGNNQSISAAKERLQARIQYKAPQIRSKRALNREKYSGSLSCGGSTNSLAELDLHMPRHNSMSSSVSSDNGYSPDRYDPFLSARRQLEELFSPATSLIHASSPVTTSTSTSRLNQMALSAATSEGHKASNDGASRTSPHNSNFRRAYSLRMPRKVSRPMYVEKAKSNIQKGITDDGPVSPNFLKSSEYDELPIKSTFNALQMAESKPKLRDSSTVRKNLKLDIRDPNHPAAGGPGDLPLSKTDSLAVFLKYETELALSEKDMKDKSNSLSKRTSSLSAETASQQRKQEPPGVNHPPAKKPETPVHEPEPKVDRTMAPSAEETNVAKKQPPKLIPIKLEPINITYNGNAGTESSATNKPVVISLDAIIGKSSCAKPKETQYDKENRSDNNYIDPKLINKCDNLPINLLKTTAMDNDGSGSTRTSSSSSGNGPLVTEGKQLLMKPIEPEEDRTVPPPPPPRTSKRVFQRPLEQKNITEKSGDSQASQASDRTQSGSSNASSLVSSHSSSPVDNRITEDSTKGDKRAPLTRQDREDSGYRTGQDSLPDTGERVKPEPTSKSSPIHQAQKTTSTNANNNFNRPTSSPPSTANGSHQPVGTIRSPISTSSTTPLNSSNGGQQGLRPRPPIVSALEDFDVDEFMQSLDDLHRQSPASAKDFKQSQFGRTQSTVTSRSVSAGQTTVASSKRSNSLDSSNSNTILSTNHHHIERTDHQTSSGVPRVDVRVRNGSGTASTHNSSNSSSSISSPSHYSKHFTSNTTTYNYSNSNNNNNSPHNHSGSKNGTETRATASADTVGHPLAQRLNANSRNSPLVARRRPSEESSTFSLPSVPPSPSGGGLSTNSTVQNLPSIHQTMGGDPWRNGNGNTAQQHHHQHQAGNVHVPARSYFSSSPSPVNGRNGGYSNNNPHHHAASHTGTPTSSTSSSHWPASFHDPRFPAESSFDHLERDLLKSVQELDRMCGSSSSVCSIDSEELYSVDEYPLHKRSSERSQASADSAYRSSLSTQSPPDYAPPVPLRQGRPCSRASSTASQKNHQADPPESTFNVLPSHTSLPPLTGSTLKGHQVEMYPSKDGMTNSSGPNLILNPMSKFCHECGARFMVSSAKFCMSCGVRRIMME